MIDFNQTCISLTKECTEQHERMKAKVFIRCMDAIGHCNNKMECPSDIFVFQSMVSDHFNKLLYF